jgi:hypothetical protein
MRCWNERNWVPLFSFWTSIDRLAKEGFKVAWLGVAFAVIGRLVSDFAWLWWGGICTTAVGLMLRHRSEYLRKLDSAPRKLTPGEQENLLRGLRNVSKAHLNVQFLAHDAEAKHYASQLRDLLEEAGFRMKQFCGAIAFEPCTGLSLMVCEWDSHDITALGIQRVFLEAGFDIKFDAILRQKEPCIEFCVNRKPSRIQEIGSAKELSKEK